MWVIRQEECLAHHGVKGQKWGVRRYQNFDGTLTSDGKKRYRDNSNSNKELKEILYLSDKQKKAIKIGAAIAGNILLAYGIYIKPLRSLKLIFLKLWPLSKMYLKHWMIMIGEHKLLEGQMVRLWKTSTLKNILKISIK